MYIPDVTDRFPEPDDSMSGHIEVGQVWEHMKTGVRLRVNELHDHYVYMGDLIFIDLDDLKNKWVLIG